MEFPIQIANGISNTDTYNCPLLCIKGSHVDFPNKYGPQREKTCLRGFANNTGADQPAHPRSLISAFVIRFLESIICRHDSGEISIF